MKKTVQKNEIEKEAPKKLSKAGKALKNGFSIVKIVDMKAVLK